MSGTLYGVGIGPGDPELLTIKAARIIAQAPVVAYPTNREGDSLALDIAGAHVTADAIRIPMPMAFDPGAGPEEAAYDVAAAAMAAHLDAGRDVAVLCLGDPFFYGSFIYLFDRLGYRYSTQVVPGISALMACSASARAPLARRNDAVIVFPATLPEDDLARRLAGSDSAVIFKLGRHLEKVCRVLDRLGLAETTQVVENATTATERVLTLTQARADGVSYFATILVHKPITQ